MSFSPDPNVVVNKMVLAMENLLTTAAAEKSVKRFVFTSSSAAALIAKQGEEIVVDKGTFGSPEEANSSFSTIFEYAASYSSFRYLE